MEGNLLAHDSDKRRLAVSILFYSFPVWFGLVCSIYDALFMRSLISLLTLGRLSEHFCPVTFALVYPPLSLVVPVG